MRRTTPNSGNKSKAKAASKASAAIPKRPRTRLSTPSPNVGGGVEALSSATGDTSALYHSVATILRTARAIAYRAINFTMVEAYWNVGRSIVEDEQQGEIRAEYGAQVMQRLSDRLCAEFGKGFSVQSLWNMRQFYQCFPILSALRRELNWSHYKALIRVDSEGARNCSTAGNLNFNNELLAMDRELGEYVIVHELLHFSVPNHGKLWKSLMRAHVGDYELLDSRLQKQASKVLAGLA